MIGMKVIIFGASGQDGYYLSQLLAKDGIDFISVSRSQGITENWVKCDVRDSLKTSELISAYCPNYIFHLAANSSTIHDHLIENYLTISGGSVAILEAAYKLNNDCRVFIAGSGLQFENENIPISETANFRCNTAYSMARIQSVYAARYFRSIGLKAYVGYLFHHESSLRKPYYVSQKIVQAAKAIGAGEERIIDLGNIDIQKEWLFAKDVSEAILTLVNQDVVYEAAIGSGLAYSIRDWLDLCFRLIGKDWNPFVKFDPSLSSDYSRLVSDPKTIMSLSWRPKISFDMLAEIMMLGKI
ncbi:GDP-mannose 4,6-dehydratase [Anabaena cylindrica UHCC 0172]|uniref:GDP-mannose 4,6-dehydratase n=1 Tax=Anabaena cylindrica TaxID=1165 RepID=UPI002B1FB482|nr:GDP-mannose 4,6-dehydratase [Anabaena cylindrica]MEA5553503.1 GDP-mannose 4,6-dehydratase [Anabaena cylindrica UHCC 0172]